MIANGSSGQRRSLLALAMVALTALAGCQSAYYAAWEKLGYEKRNILASRVEKARDAQTEARDEVVSALESFSQAVNYQGSELETQYQRFKSQLEDGQDAADNVRERIDNVESTGDALFSEWKNELDNYADASLRARSQQQMIATKTRYTRMLAAMKKARDRLAPALKPLSDQVLFLKHNLNASVLNSMKGQVKLVDAEVDRLVTDINTAVVEANSFIEQFR